MLLRGLKGFSGRASAASPGAPRSRSEAEQRTWQKRGFSGVKAEKHIIDHRARGPDPRIVPRGADPVAEQHHDPVGIGIAPQARAREA